MVLNAAARLVVGASRRDHISPVKHDVLHWLPVTQRIHFKIAVMHSTASVALVQPTSKTTAAQWSTPPVEHLQWALIVNTTHFPVKAADS